jgi:lysine-N-methylase
MAPPIHPLPIVERWDCHACGICCRGALVELSDRDIKQLREQGWQEEEEFRDTKIIVRDRQIGGYRLAQRDDENCVFLTAEGLCQIHQRFGFDAKPERCKVFPLQVVSLGDMAYITTRRACPSAAADRGRPVAEHADALQYFRQALVDQHLAAPPAIAPGCTRDWTAVRLAGRSIERLVCSGKTSLAERLARALAFCDHLESSLIASPAPSPNAYKQLLRQCEDKATRGSLPDEPPGNVATSLMRQAVVDYLLLHPKRRSNRSLLGKWRRAWRLLRMARGQGRIPDLGCGFPIANFADLEKPLDGLDAQSARMIDRYYETMAMSMQYLMMTRAGWSVTESFRALALTYPAGMWLLRWQCLGRQPREADVFDLITTAERSNTTPRLAGYRHQRLVRVLARDAQLGALVRWYGR